MFEPIKILLVEDDEDDFVLTRELLHEIFGSQVGLDWIADPDDALDAILGNTHDICLVDYRLGRRDGIDLVREATRQDCSAPIILLTGLDDREIDIQAMEAGAADYLVKGQITAPLLDRAIRYAIERKRIQESLAKLAQYDPLTGLANRSLFQSRLKDALANAKRTGQMVAIMLLDLDHFKDINDSLGHPAGDALLKEVAARLKHNVRETDTVARLGGDEFAVIATNIDHLEGVATVAEKLVDAIAVPFGFEYHEIRTGTSVGISVSPPDVSEPEHLLKHADFALYQAKSAGRGTWQFYDAEMNAKRQARKTMEDHLARALGRNEFTLFYQPKVHARTGVVTGVEALIRWLHPEYGMVPPAEFIPIAEESGQIIEIGAWVVRTACAQHLAWREAGLPPIPVAINLSSVQFKDGNLPLTLRAIMAEFGLSPQFFELEITESVIVENTESVSEQFRMLRKLGHPIAIDDFGTGYSSLAYLKQFPVDKLKIDRAFVANITEDPGDAALAKGIIALAKSLGMGVVAEGVETAGQLALLRRHGCEEIQGYYYSPPITAEAFAVWYRARAKKLKDADAASVA